MVEHVERERQARSRAWSAWEQRARKDATRDQRIAILTRGITEAVREAPDAFPVSFNPRWAATLVVDAL